MPPHVLLAVNCRPEALRTEGTPVWPQARVRGHVSGEAAIGGERGVADTAAERLHSCDNGKGKHHFFTLESY